MSLLTNNGLLWLILSLALALIILLIIYLIRPNYQQKYVSSTFVWVLSLKYRKKRVPINRLRNILIIICQVLILAACAFIIARPAIQLFEDYTVSEVVIIMDTSASMRTANEDGTRIERAVADASEYGREVLEDGGIVSVITCGNGAEVLLDRAMGEDRISDLDGVFETILEEGCTYASTDLNEALQICEDRILAVNADAAVVIYTDSLYTDDYLDSLPEGLEIICYADENSEWNAAILNAYTEKIEGYYAIFVEFATYGRSATLNFEVSIKNPKCDGEGLLVEGTEEENYFIIDEEVLCDPDETMTYVFMYDETYDTTYASIIGSMDNYFVSVSADYTIYSYEEISVTLLDSTEDSYDLDNTYYIYGGQPQVINVLYSTVTEGYNTYMPRVLSSVQDAYASEYDILITYLYVTEETVDEVIEGYDFYIYEHIAPTELPTDGVVFLFDPDSAPENAGFQISGTYEYVASYDVYLSFADGAEDSPLMAGMTPENIFITKASLIKNYDPDYVPLLEFEANDDRYPALLMKDNGDSKVVVMPFSVNYSNFAVRIDYPLFFFNMFSYFFPSVITGSEFVVGDTLTVTTNGAALVIWREADETWNRAYDEMLLWVACEEYEETYTVIDGVGWLETEVEMPISFVAGEPGRYFFEIHSYFTDGEDLSKLSEVRVFVHADLGESDIFSYGTALSSPYREREVSELYDDLLLYFAIALVALIFIEWILHMLEGL